MKEDTKIAVRRRLARMEGQVRGLMNMVEEERECIDVLTQVAAIRAALEAFGSVVLTEHIEEVVGPSGMPEARKDALRATLERFVK
jgi:DNA-binding FrmR family transcriptional regulator